MEPCPQRGEQALVAAMAAIGQAFRKSEGQLRHLGAVGECPVSGGRNWHKSMTKLDAQEAGLLTRRKKKLSRHLASFWLTSHHSAESCISINRLRWRLRSHAPTIHASTLRPSAVPTIAPVKTKSLVPLDVHKLTAPTAARVATITMRMSLMLECPF